MSVPSASFSGASLIGARVGPHGFRVRAGGVGGVGVREGIGGRNRSFGGRRAQRWRRRHRRGGGRCLRLAGLLELHLLFELLAELADRKSTRLNSSHEWISYAVFCLKKKTHHT